MRESVVEISQSLIVARSIIREIIRRSTILLLEHHLENSIPQQMPKWSLLYSEEVLRFINPPDLEQINEPNQGLLLEIEPKSKIIDPWRSFIANIDLRFPDDLSTYSSIKSNKINVTIRPIPSRRISQPNFELFEPKIVLMSETPEEDLIDKGLRQQLESNLQLKQQKKQAELQRQLERKEQQKQIKQLASSLSKYTFDYQGKFLPQTTPENLAPIRPRVSSMIQLQERTKIMDFGKSFAHNSIVYENEIKSIQQSQVILQAKSNSQLMDLIDVARGVTLIQGNEQKQGPIFEEDIQLQQSNLKLTKNQYRLISGTIKRESNINKQIETNILTEPQHQINNTTLQHSMSIGGSIRIDGNVEDLLITETDVQQSIQQLPKLLLKQRDLKQLIISSDAIKQSKPILPKHTLPTLIKPRCRSNKLI